MWNKHSNSNDFKLNIHLSRRCYFFLFVPLLLLLLLICIESSQWHFKSYKYLVGSKGTFCYLFCDAVVAFLFIASLFTIPIRSFCWRCCYYYCKTAVIERWWKRKKKEKKNKKRQSFLEVKPNYYKVYRIFIIFSNVMFQIFLGVFIEGLFWIRL